MTSLLCDDLSSTDSDSGEVSAHRCSGSDGESVSSAHLVTGARHQRSQETDSWQEVTSVQVVAQGIPTREVCFDEFAWLFETKG